MLRKVCQRKRRGVILVVVLAMLLLFAGLGLTFALIAKTESQAARNFKRKFSGTVEDRLSLFQEILAQVIYDTRKLNSALRGHSIPVDIEPIHPKMGHLAAEVAKTARSVLTRKRGSSDQGHE